MGKVIIVGSINTDLVVKTSRIPEAGETISGEGFFTAHGGKGANQAVASARLGGQVVMCGAVGDDDFGVSALNSLKSEGIDTSCIKVCKGVSTGVAVITLSKGDNRIILDGGANNLLTKEDVDGVLNKASKGDIYLTQLENPIEVIGYGLKRAKELGLYVILNPAPANVDIKPYLRYCDLITPNESEVELLGGKESLSSQVKTLLVTLGSKGFEIFQNGNSTQYPCMKITPVDTTAAGDTLCGGLATRLSNGWSLADAAKFGSKAATIACTRLGAQTSIPTKDQVENFN